MLRCQHSTRPAHSGRHQHRTGLASCHCRAAAAPKAVTAVAAVAAVLEEQPPAQEQLLEVELQSYYVDATHSTATAQPHQKQTPASIPVHQWGDGAGLTPEQFVAAIQALPMQQQLRWSSIYPAIGEGSRGKVFQAVNLDTGAMLAVKVVSLKHHMGPGREAALRREALVLELAAMQDYDHPNLLAMQGFCYRPSKINPQLEIFSELGCCLEDMLPADSSAQPLGVALVQKIMSSLLSALDFLHSRGVVHRDIKPGNIVSVGRRGTFKLIDMDSMFFARSCQLHPQQRYSMGVPCPRAASTHLAGQAAAAVAATAAAAVTLQRQQQQLLQEEEHHGDNDLIFDIPAADNQQQQQKKQKWRHSLLPLSRRRRRAAAAAAAATAGGSHYEGELNALSFSGTPENMAPEAAPLVVETPLLLMDLLPLREGKQLPSATPVSPSQDIWSAGTVLWELVMGRPLFDDFESPEALYQHLGEVRQAVGHDRRLGQLLPRIPPHIDEAVVEMLEACLQVDPAKRPTANQLLQMKFFSRVY